MSGTAKAFGLSIEYVLYEMSYANLIMYGATLPSYHKKKEGKGKGDKGNGEETISADDPRNNERLMALISEMK